MRILNEVRRSELVAKSKSSDKEKDGKTRFQKRVKSRVLSNVKNLNQIDMNKLFYEDLLTVNIDVQGETDKYTVTMSFGGFLDQVQRDLRDGEEFDLRVAIKALVAAFNSDNVYIHCTCPDWKYRMAYWSTKNGTNSGEEELRPSDITNPKDTKGPGCKHTMLVLGNHSWLIKVASVIVNYVNWMKQNREMLYADVLYPAIYGKEYTEEPVQMSIDDKDSLETDVDTINKANQAARSKGQFKQGNEFRFTKGYNRPERTVQIGMEDGTEG